MHPWLVATALQAASGLHDAAAVGVAKALALPSGNAHGPGTCRTW
jgi:hypothetical protein